MTNQYKQGQNRRFLPLFLPHRDGALTPAAQAEVMTILTNALRAAIGQG
jgi:hypothetical protein